MGASVSLKTDLTAADFEQRIGDGSPVPPPPPMGGNDLVAFVALSARSPQIAGR